MGIFIVIPLEGVVDRNDFIVPEGLILASFTGGNNGMIEKNHL